MAFNADQVQSTILKILTAVGGVIGALGYVDAITLDKDINAVMVIVGIALPLVSWAIGVMNHSDNAHIDAVAKIADQSDMPATASVVRTLKDTKNA